MEERITPYLKRLIRGGKRSIEIQFRAVPHEDESRFTEADPLGEESRYTPVKGLVHKYANRVLWKVSYRCAAHCQICTRMRQIGSPEGDLTNEDITRCSVGDTSSRTIRSNTVLELWALRICSR